MRQLLLGLDIGSSSIKASIVDAATGKSVASGQSPREEMAMIALEPGWAEQDPDMWWHHLLISVKSAIKSAGAGTGEIQGIGISYQMHGLVVVDKDQKPLRPSIIWCDSRAVEIGQRACDALGDKYCLEHFLNSPGNFTASKLKWVKENEPSVFEKIYKFMLPGDYIAMRLSGDIVTTDTGLSEGIFWDYETRSVSDKLLNHYGFDKKLLPALAPRVRRTGPGKSGCRAGTRHRSRCADLLSSRRSTQQRLFTESFEAGRNCGDCRNVRRYLRRNRKECIRFQVEGEYFYSREQYPREPFEWRTVMC